MKLLIVGLLLVGLTQADHGWNVIPGHVLPEHPVITHEFRNVDGFTRTDGGLVHDEYGVPHEEYGPPHEEYGVPHEEYGVPEVRKEEPTTTHVCPTEDYQAAFVPSPPQIENFPLPDVSGIEVKQVAAAAVATAVHEEYGVPTLPPFHEEYGVPEVKKEVPVVEEVYGPPIVAPPPPAIVPLPEYVPPPTTEAPKVYPYAAPTVPPVVVPEVKSEAPVVHEEYGPPVVQEVYGPPVVAPPPPPINPLPVYVPPPPTVAPKVYPYPAPVTTTTTTLPPPPPPTPAPKVYPYPAPATTTTTTLPPPPPPVVKVFPYPAPVTTTTTTTLPPPPPPPPVVKVYPYPAPVTTTPAPVIQKVIVKSKYPAKTISKYEDSHHAPGLFHRIVRHLKPKIVIHKKIVTFPHFKKAVFFKAHH